jgi:hypothetical protein
MKQSIEELKAVRQAYIKLAKQWKHIPGNKPIQAICTLGQQCLDARHIVDMKMCLETR